MEQFSVKFDKCKVDNEDVVGAPHKNVSLFLSISFQYIFYCIPFWSPVLFLGALSHLLMSNELDITLCPTACLG